MLLVYTLLVACCSILSAQEEAPKLDAKKSKAIVIDQTAAQANDLIEEEVDEETIQNEELDETE